MAQRNPIVRFTKFDSAENRATTRNAVGRSAQDPPRQGRSLSFLMDIGYSRSSVRHGMGVLREGKYSNELLGTIDLFVRCPQRVSMIAQCKTVEPRITLHPVRTCSCRLALARLFQSQGIIQLHRLKIC